MMYIEAPQTLQSLLNICAQQLPALAGDSQLTPLANKQQERVTLSLLFRHLKNHHTQADHIYWGNRTWQLWIWQALYVSVWAASKWNIAIKLNHVEHSIDNIFTAKFKLAEHKLQRYGNQSLAIQHAVQELNSWICAQRQLIEPIYPLSEKLTQYYLVDSTLKALCVAHRTQFLSKDDVLSLEKLWLNALPGCRQSYLVWRDDNQEFYVERQACCQHFRIDANDLCQGCPKIRAKQTHGISYTPKLIC